MIIAASTPAEEVWRSALNGPASISRERHDEWAGECARIAVGAGSQLVSRDRAALALSGQLRGVTDPREILDGYLSEGTSWFKSRRGQFSFVLCDDRRGLLIGGRDSLGTVGLAWHEGRSGRWVSSRVVDLLPVVGETLRWNRTYLADWLLGVASQPPSLTAFQQVHRCPPGELVLVSPRGVRLSRFDHVRDLARQVPNKSSVTRFNRLLERNVIGTRRRSALSFSGGIDSTSVAEALAAVTSSFDVLTYRLPVGPSRSEEGRRMQFLRRHPEAMSLVVELPVTLFDIGHLDDLTRDSLSFDDPPHGSVALLPATRTFYSTAAGRGFDELLDGDGGDEIFELPASPIDLWIGKERVTALRMLASDSRFTSPAARARFLFGILPPGWVRDRIHNVIDFLPGSLSHEFLKTAAAQEALVAFQCRSGLRRYYERMLAVLLSTASEAYLGLKRSMAREFGIKVHSPLWDPDIVELASSLTPGERISHSRQKVFMMTALSARGWHARTNSRGKGRTYRNLARLAVSKLGNVIVERVAEVELLASWINLPDLHNRVAHSETADFDEVDFLVRLYFGASWMCSVERRFLVK